MDNDLRPASRGTAALWAGADALRRFRL